MCFLMKKRFWKFQPIIKHNCPNSHIEFLDETKITDNVENHTSNLLFVLFDPDYFKKKFEM